MATKTPSTVVAHTGEHVLKVVGHSQITGSNSVVMSETFRVGGHGWAIRYYPNGDFGIVDDQFSSVYLKLINAGDEGEVTASYSLCLLDPAAPTSATGEKNGYSYRSAKFLPGGQGKGTNKFVSKDDLAASGCLKDDCLLIKCTVGVSKLTDASEDDSIVVPPSDLSKHLGNLLENGLKADLTVRIGWFKTFRVHGCVLAARSPVFRAQLCGSMMESKASSIRIKHMDAKVFEVFLHYMYNDCLPDFMEETMNMTQHSLVAADRYAMERLKLMCQAKLSKALEVETVGFTLDLADQYHCQQLKDHCLKYMVRDNERLRAIVKTKGFEQLRQNKPCVAYDILDKVIDKL